MNPKYQIILHPICKYGRQMFESSLQNAEIITNSGYIPTALVVINGDSENLKDIYRGLNNQMHIILVSVIEITIIRSKTDFLFF